MQILMTKLQLTFDFLKNNNCVLFNFTAELTHKLYCSEIKVTIDKPDEKHRKRTRKLRKLAVTDLIVSTARQKGRGREKDDCDVIRGLKQNFSLLRS